ncbi:eukaryotic translation initiation factor 4 gamma-like [Lathyrus oleraceus]|uniref:eukaryotic translation initiation factor 4 gamma-like n=1 Tax=Pisum sativum TaxID=3888 RepID=UPI0021D0AFDD|nr:eukaryotic translation initiation factor 4 gamma-like [Pisum sativum]
MKRMREPSEKSKKAKKAKLGESSRSRPLIPLVGSPDFPSPPPKHPNRTTSEQTPPTQQPIHYEPQPTQPPSKQTPQPELSSQSHSDIPPSITSADPTTPTLNLSAPNSPSSPSLASTTKPETTLPTLEEAIQVFVESSVEKVKSLTINSGISGDPSAVRIHWNKVISWMTSEAFKLKGLYEQVRNNFIRDAGIRLQERLAREAEERERKETEEKARQEELQRIREAEAKAAADTAAAEVEAKSKADIEEAARVAEKVIAKANVNELTQGEHFNSRFVPLVLKTLEELHK